MPKTPWTKNKPLVQRVLRTIQYDLKTHCWWWLGTRSRDGYARIGIGRLGSVAVHRLAYELLRGPIPDGLELDHLCRHRSCVNPDHLEPVTRRENQLRGESPAGRAARTTHCPSGHALTIDNLTNHGLKRGFRECLECKRIRSRGRWPERRRRAAENAEMKA